MENRLFLIEGLPCAGKSTTSKYVSKLLEEKGYKVVWVDEGTGRHPADYEFQSYIAKEQLEVFSKEEQEQVLKAATKKKAGYIVELGLLKGKTFEKAVHYKIYDYLPWEVEKEIMLEHWETFAKEADPNCIYIFNCCFLQNPMCETMIRFGFDREVSKRYIESIVSTVTKMKPVCLYLQQDDIGVRIQSTAQERGEEWLKSVVDYHVKGAYGKQNQLEGFEEYTLCLEERQKRELDILKSLGIEHLILHNASEDWKSAYSQIDHFIEQLH